MRSFAKHVALLLLSLIALVPVNVAAQEARANYQFDSPYLIIPSGKVRITKPDGSTEIVEPTAQKIPDVPKDSKTSKASKASTASPTLPPIPGVVALEAGSRVESIIEESSSDPSLELTDDMDERTKAKIIRALRINRQITDMVKILSPEDSVSIRIDKGAEAKLTAPEALDQKDPPSSLEILKGELYFDIDSKQLQATQPPREFRVRLPKNILAVKGTRFGVSVSEDLVAVLTDHGRVEAFDLAGTPLGKVEYGRIINLLPNKINLYPNSWQDDHRSLRENLKQGYLFEKLLCLEPHPREIRNIVATDQKYRKAGLREMKPILRPDFITWKTQPSKGPVPGNLLIHADDHPATESRSFLHTEISIPRMNLPPPGRGRGTAFFQIRSTRAIHVWPLIHFKYKKGNFFGSWPNSDGIHIAGDNKWSVVRIPYGFGPEPETWPPKYGEKDCLNLMIRVTDQESLSQLRQSNPVGNIEPFDIEIKPVYAEDL